MPEDELKKKIVVTGGGSGGHVYTALSLMKALRDKYRNSPKLLLYIGGDLGMENDKAGNSIDKKVFCRENFSQEYIRAGKLQRSFSFKSLILLFRTTLAFIDSYRIINKFKPDIVISTGGFVSVPVCLIAKIFGSEIYLHEQTSTVGLSNRIVGKFAKKIFIAFPSSIEFFPKEKTIHTGNLLREEIFKENSNASFSKELKSMIEEQEESPIIYISGGSLGSHTINITVKECLYPLLQKYQLIVQTGDNQKYKDFEILQKEKKKLPKELQSKLLILKYIDSKEIGLVLNNIDLFVGRSGANTVYEMGILQIPSIFIPIPWVTNNEQEKNARILRDLGIAEIIHEGELTPETLVLKINRFINKTKNYNKEELSRMFPVNAIDIILDQIKI